MNDAEAIALALAEAEAAAARGEVPVGAVLLSAAGEVLARDGNRIVERRDPTAHAEMLVLRAGAEKLGNERLIGTTLYVSLEPCAMCAGAISWRAWRGWCSRRKIPRVAPCSTARASSSSRPATTVPSWPAPATRKRRRCSSSSSSALGGVRTRFDCSGSQWRTA